jgi:hypothetical protein
MVKEWFGLLLISFVSNMDVCMHTSMDVYVRCAGCMHVFDML